MIPAVQAVGGGTMASDETEAGAEDIDAEATYATSKSSPAKRRSRRVRQQLYPRSHQVHHYLHFYTVIGSQVCLPLFDYEAVLRAPSGMTSSSPTSAPGCPERNFSDIRRRPLDDEGGMRSCCIIRGCHLHQNPDVFYGGPGSCAHLWSTHGRIRAVDRRGLFSKAARRSVERRLYIIGIPGIVTTSVDAVWQSPSIARDSKYHRMQRKRAAAKKISESWKVCDIPAGGLGEDGFSGPSPLALLADIERQTLMNGSVFMYNRRSV